MVLVPDISCRTSGIRAEASNSNFVPSLLSCLIKATIASGFAILIPIPIVALSALFGIIATSLFADPMVNLSSGNGSAIMFGEEDLTDTTLDLGIGSVVRCQDPLEELPLTQVKALHGIFCFHLQLELYHYHLF